MNKLTKYEKIRQSFIDQLTAKGANIEVLVDQVDNYVTLCKIYDKLEEDVNERGEVMPDTGKPNPCIKDLQNTTKSKLAILARLGIDANSIITSGDDEL